MKLKKNIFKFELSSYQSQMIEMQNMCTTDLEVDKYNEYSKNMYETLDTY